MREQDRARREGFAWGAAVMASVEAFFEVIGAILGAAFSGD